MLIPHFKPNESKAFSEGLLKSLKWDPLQLGVWGGWALTQSWKFQRTEPGREVLPGQAREPESSQCWLRKWCLSLVVCQRCVERGDKL